MVNGTKAGRRGAGSVLALATATVSITVGFIGSEAGSAVAQQQPTVLTTFECLGIPQEFVVPTGVTTISMFMAGASGGGSTGGGGGSIAGTMNVTPGNVLTVTVGCRESTRTETTHGGGYGWASGGNGVDGPFQTGGNSGGGASGINLGSIILAVGGGRRRSR